MLPKRLTHPQLERRFSPAIEQDITWVKRLHIGHGWHHAADGDIQVRHRPEHSAGTGSESSCDCRAAIASGGQKYRCYHAKAVTGYSNGDRTDFQK